MSGSNLVSVKRSMSSPSESANSDKSSIRFGAVMLLMFACAIVKYFLLFESLGPGFCSTPPITNMS